MGWKSVARGGLSRRNDTYYIRLRVPEELVKSIGKTHVTKSLKTTDYKIAKDRYVRQAAEVLAEFDRHRNSAIRDNLASNAIITAQRFDDLSIVELRAKAGAWFRREHQALPYAYSFLSERNDPNRGDDADPSFDDEFETKDQAIWSLSRLLHTLTTGSPAEVDDALTPIIAHFCREENIACERVRRSDNTFATETRIAADVESPKYRTFRTMILRGKTELLQQQIAYLSGQAMDFGDRNIAAAYKAPFRVTKGSITLEELIGEFLADPSRRNMKRTLELNYSFLFRILREVLGAEKLLSEVTRDDCKAVRELLLRLPTNVTKRFPDLPFEKAAAEAAKKGVGKMSGVTINSHLHKMSALFNFAVKEERMDRNPARGLAISGFDHSEEDRLPFSSAQLKLIFAAPIYRGCENDQDGWARVGDARPRGTKFWIPLIALFHGLRLNEICQLRTEDIGEEDGVPFFHIRNGEKGQRVKSEAGRRKVPVHPTFTEFGFCEFVEKCRNQGQTRIFSDLKKDSRGYYSDGFQKWFSRFLEDAGASSEKTSFHSFRHCWRDALRRGHVPQERARLLGGWKRTATDEKYGSDLTVKELLIEVSKVQYDLDLFHLKA